MLWFYYFSFPCLAGDLQVALLNSADGDLKLKELSLAVLARLALADTNVDVVYAALHKIETGCGQSLCPPPVRW